MFYACLIGVCGEILLFTAIVNLAETGFNIQWIVGVCIGIALIFIAGLILKRKIKST